MTKKQLQERLEIVEKQNRQRGLWLIDCLDNYHRGFLAWNYLMVINIQEDVGPLEKLRDQKLQEGVDLMYSHPGVKKALGLVASEGVEPASL